MFNNNFTNAMNAMNIINNPKDFVLKSIGNDFPMFNNLISKAENGQTKEVEEFAKNFCKENGIDFEKAFPQFMNMIGQNKRR